MATIKIDDLTESVVLDREAMAAICGGARRFFVVAPIVEERGRVVEFGGAVGGAFGKARKGESGSQGKVGVDSSGV